MGQRTHLFYKPPRGALMAQYMDGLYYALLEGRFLFDFVHEDKLAPEQLNKYTALLLPNTALLSRSSNAASCAPTPKAGARCWRPSRPASTTSAMSAVPISVWLMSSAFAKPAT